MGEGRRASPFPGYEGPLPQRTHSFHYREQGAATAPQNSWDSEVEILYRHSNNHWNLGIFKNNTCLDYVLSQDSGFFSTMLKEEGTRSSSLAEVSLGQILGTCGFLVPPLELHQH